MMRWFFPSFSGDFRLEARADGMCALHVTSPTEAEKVVVAEFLRRAGRKGWVEPLAQKAGQAVESAKAVKDGREPATVYVIGASVAKAGAVLLRVCRPKRTTLTAVSASGGRVEVTEGAQTVAMPPGAKAAVSVRRPTLCCPRCVEGPIDAATEVLYEFCSPEEKRDWQQHHAIVVEGGVTGHRYLLAHRHSDVARRMGWIARDLDDRATLHFHDWLVPPPEEVLAAKLMLEHRESWLRNDATLWHERHRVARLDNPFGDYRDGTGSRAVLSGIGGAFVGHAMPSAVSDLAAAAGLTA